MARSRGKGGGRQEIPPPQKSQFINLGQLPGETGVYAVCDLDKKVIYVGQSADSIRSRVRRHLTSARSDPIANRQLDIWEIAYIWAWVERSTSTISELEKRVHHEYRETIIAGEQLSAPSTFGRLPNHQEIQIRETEDIKKRQDPRMRFPRQLLHLEQLLDYILNVKDTSDQRRSLDGHMKRLQQRFAEFTSSVVTGPDDAAEGGP